MPFKSLLKGHPPNEVESDHPIEYCSLPPRPLHWTVEKFLDTGDSVKGWKKHGLWNKIELEFGIWDLLSISLGLVSSNIK